MNQGQESSFAVSSEIRVCSIYHKRFRLRYVEAGFCKYDSLDMTSFSKFFYRVDLVLRNFEMLHTSKGGRYVTIKNALLLFVGFG